MPSVADAFDDARRIKAENKTINIGNQWNCEHERDQRYILCADCSAALDASVRGASASDNDPVNPDHYKVGGIETIEFIEAKLSPEEFAGYCRGNAMKYISRAGHKDVTAIEIGKAIWYLQRWRDSLLHTDTPT
jgi:hypothetical protein